jgi:hypothetical protein
MCIEARKLALREARLKIKDLARLIEEAFGIGNADPVLLHLLGTLDELDRTERALAIARRQGAR